MGVCFVISKIIFKIGRNSVMLNVGLYIFIFIKEIFVEDVLIK